MNSNGELDASFSGNTINYNGSSYQAIKTPLTSYFHLRTSGSGDKTVQNVLSIAGDLTIGASTTLNSNGQDLTLAGNWINNGAFTEGTRTVTFNGANNQNISNPLNETFYNLLLNNSGSSGNNNLVLSNSVACNGVLTMTSGNIVTGTNTLTLTNNSSTALVYTSGTIIGRFKREW